VQSLKRDTMDFLESVRKKTKKIDQQVCEKRLIELFAIFIKICIVKIQNPKFITKILVVNKCAEQPS
jgi:hypothetical protein